MFFKSLVDTLSNSYNNYNDNNFNFNNVNPSIVKYFRNEYGADWKTALEYHIYKEKIKNNKKVA